MKDNFFKLYPAIDIKDGKCVRLLFGEMEKETVYNNNPLDQAMWFVDQGAEWLHIVDLDGAVAGKLLKDFNDIIEDPFQIWMQSNDMEII